MDIAQQKPNIMVERFLSHCQIRSYPAKRILIQQERKNESLYYITRGSAAIFIKDESGREMIVSYLNKGDFIGEKGLFGITQKSNEYIIAKTQCTIGEISYKNFNTLVLTNPEILQYLASNMAKILQITADKIADLAFSDVTSRIAHTLIDLAKQPDAITHPAGMQFKITRQEIGQLVCCSRETVGRILKLLETQKLISACGKTIVVYGTR